MDKQYSFSEAVTRGSALEHMVACMLRTICGFEVLEQHRTGTRSSVDNCRITVDGFVVPNDFWPQGFCYECKDQNVSGTAHKRIPMHVIDAREKLYPAPLLFIIDGAFFAKKAAGKSTVKWVKNQADGDLILGAFSTQELVTWCQRTKGREAPIMGE